MLRAESDSETRGIILAGGSGTRLGPLTYTGLSKQLQRVYDKPAIYYPLTTLIEGGIRDILIISTPRDLPHIQSLLNDGNKWGINLSYIEQPKPEGLAQAFIIGRDFVQGHTNVLILGDNLFHVDNLGSMLEEATKHQSGAYVFASHVKDPQRYGVVEFNSQGEAISLEEKPSNPRSSYAVTGLYVYDEQIVEIAANLKPSKRGELEITDANNQYLRNKQLRVQRLDLTAGWYDMGTPDSLEEASQFVQNFQGRLGSLIGSPELAAYRRGYINPDQLEILGRQLGSSAYGKSLEKVAKGDI